MEPNTNGRVSIQTTHGPLHIELWSKECPLACKNFIQLCLEGYYDGSPFHRIVPGFCVQTGRSVRRYEDSEDADLEAELGAAAFTGGRFAIETHSRLKFSRRGLLGMATVDSDPKRANTSQFFFTLAEAPELNGKATLFGRLVGESIYNLLRLAEVEVDPKTEAPLYAPKIISTQVTLNPFDDIVVRERKVIILETISAKPTSSTAAIAKKNTKLLSFEEEEAESSGIKSSHDILNDPKLSKTSVNTTNAKPSEQQSKAKLESMSTSNTTTTTSSLSFLEQMKAAQLKETQRKIAQVEAELGMRTAPKTSTQSAKKNEEKPLSALEKHRLKYLEAGHAQNAKRKPDSRDEMDTLLKLNSFRSKIQKNKSSATKEEESTKPGHVDICKLHGLINCLSCRDTFGVKLDGGPEDEEGWMMHQLVFDRQELDTSIREDLKQLVVIDPRDKSKPIQKK